MKLQKITDKNYPRFGVVIYEEGKLLHQASAKTLEEAVEAGNKIAEEVLPGASVVVITKDIGFIVS